MKLPPVGCISCRIPQSSISYDITRSITRPINRSIAELTDSSDQITAASNQVSASSQSLALRSAEAAKNTTSMIEASVKNSQNGVDIATEVARMLEGINGASRKVNDLVGEIAAASQEQAQGIDQVNTALNQMDKVTQQNTANAEESAGASQQLNAQARQMKESVSDLVALVGASTNRKVSPEKEKSIRGE